MSMVQVEIVEVIPTRDYMGREVKLVSYFIRDGDKRIPAGGQPAHIILGPGEDLNSKVLELKQEYLRSRAVIM